MNTFNMMVAIFGVTIIGTAFTMLGSVVFALLLPEENREQHAREIAYHSVTWGLLTASVYAAIIGAVLLCLLPVYAAACLTAGACCAVRMYSLYLQ